MIASKSLEAWDGSEPLLLANTYLMFFLSLPGAGQHSL